LFTAYAGQLRGADLEGFFHLRDVVVESVETCAPFLVHLSFKDAQQGKISSQLLARRGELLPDILGGMPTQQASSLIRTQCTLTINRLGIIQVSHSHKTIVVTVTAVTGQVQV